MTGLRRIRRLAGKEPVEYAEQIANDKSVRRELQLAGSHASALVRGVRRGGRWELLRGVRDRDVQRHAVGLVQSLDRALKLVEPRPRQRRRHALATLAVGVGAAGLAAAVAKSMLGGR